MTIQGTDIEKACKFLLQKEIVIELKNKTHKKKKSHN